MRQARFGLNAFAAHAVSFESELLPVVSGSAGTYNG